MSDTVEIHDMRLEPEDPAALSACLKARIEKSETPGDAVAALRQLNAVFVTGGLQEDALFYYSCLQMAYKGTALSAEAFCLSMPFLIKKRLHEEVINGCRAVAARFPGSAWAARCRHTLAGLGGHDASVVPHAVAVPAGFSISGQL